MSFTNIVTQQVTQAGITQTTVVGDVTNGNVVDTDWRVWLYLENTGGSTATVTIQVPGTQDGMTIGPRAITLAAAAKKLVLMSPTNYAQPYGTTNYGRAQITFSVAATVNVGVFKV